MGRRTFKAATWNVFHGTPPSELRPILQWLLRSGVSIILGQEMQEPKVRELLRDEGLRVAFNPRQYVVAWDPDVWDRVSPGEAVRLGRTAYYAKGGDHEQYSDAVRVILRHRATGLTLDALSYHTPAHVQYPEAARPPRRFQALRESMATMGRLARQGRGDAVLYGGDDNVDEFQGFGAGGTVWRFMLRAATGLRQVRAPEPTHGHPDRGRRIDDFRTRRLRPGPGQVRPGGGDHRVHVREFTFRRRPRA